MKICQAMPFEGFGTPFGVFSKTDIWPLGLNPTEHLFFSECSWVRKMIE